MTAAISSRPQRGMWGRQEELNAIQAYATCETVIRAHSSSFFHAFRHLPAAERQAVYAVYAFCRKVDTMADQDAPPAVKLFQLRAVEEQIRAAKRGVWTDDDAVWVALHDVFSHFPMQWGPFDDMVRGQYADVDFRAPQSLDDLLEYCYLVAGTVGLMLLPILAPGRSARLRHSAAALGVAMQLTNILRDVREDAAMGRVYIPSEWMTVAGLRHDDLSGEQMPAGFVMIGEGLAAQATSFYEMGLRVWRLYPAHSRLPLLASGRFYGAILEEASARGWDVFARRIVVSDDRKRQLQQILEAVVESPKSVPTLALRPCVGVEAATADARAATNRIRAGLERRWQVGVQGSTPL